MSNTKSLDLEKSSQQYAHCADNSSLSLTGDLTLECYIKPESLPASDEIATLVAKWDEQSNKRSYKMDILGVNGYFGDGSDEALTISTNTTHTPIDSACTGTAGSKSLTATNANFAANQEILIHQTQGTGVGNWEKNRISSYTAGTITCESGLANTYATGAQVIVLKKYSNVTVNSGVIWTAKAWDGSTGGILAFLASGTLTVTGTITAAGKGFRGGTGGQPTPATGYRGEGSTGDYRTTSPYHTANGNAGGGGDREATSSCASGGGGGNGAAGTDGWANTGGSGGTGGAISGNAALTSFVLGGGGGGGGSGDGIKASGSGGAGGGGILVFANNLSVSGHIYANGNTGEDSPSGTGTGDGGAGGGGAGGSILLRCVTGSLGSALITATGGAGGSAAYDGGGDGGTGRIRLDYKTSYSGTTSPTLSASQDDTLNATTTYSLRLLVSSTGTNSEALSKTIAISADTCYHIAISWDASAANATFYLNSTSQGSSVGTLTSINDNASAFMIGASKDSNGNPVNFFDGRIDDVRVWSDIRTSTEISANYTRELAGNDDSLSGYWKFNSDYNDTTANGSNLTPSGLPSFSSIVCFSDATTTSTSTTTTSTSTTTTSTSTTTTSTSTSTSSSTSTTTTLTSTTTTSTSTTTTSTSTSTTTTSTSTTTTSTSIELVFMVERVS